MNKLMIVLIILLIIITIKYYIIQATDYICRQLSFISNNVTNQRIRIEESERSC